MAMDNASDHAARETGGGKASDILDSLMMPPSIMNNVEEDSEEELNVGAEGNEPSQIDETIDGNDNVLENGQSSAFKKAVVKADGEEREFVLDPNNEDLITTLQYGVAGKRAFTKAQKLVGEYKKKLADYEKKYTSDVLDKAKSLDGIAALVEKGYTKQAVEALLGERYNDFVKNEVVGTVEYENASPDERAQMDRERARRDREWLEFQKNSKISELEQRLNDREEAIEQEKWHGLGTNLLQKYSMSNYVDDPVRAEKLNNIMWKHVWNDMAEVDGEWTPRKLELAFREISSVMRGNLNKTVKDRVTKTIANKKQQAKEQAQMSSERNYSKDKASEIREQIQKEASPMKRLGMLLGR